MMDDFFGSDEEIEDVDGKELIVRYEDMITKNHPIYLSSDDYELLFMHYVHFLEDAFLEDMNLKMAAKVIRAGIKQYPNAPLLHVFYLYYQFLKGEITKEKAVELLQYIEFPEYERLSQNYHVAAVYIKMDAFEPARSLYENMLKSARTDEDMERIYTDLVFLTSKPEEIRQGLNYLVRLLEIVPQKEPYLLDELYAQYMFNDDMGVSFFKAFVDKFPFSVKGWHCLGEMYSSQFLFDLAVDAMNNAIALSNKIEPIVSLAGIYRSWGRNQEALDAFHEAMSLSPENRDFYADMAEVYHVLEQYETAIYYFGLTLDDNPDHLPALMGIALSFAAQENYTDAIRYLRKAVKMDYAPVEAWLLLADYLIETECEEEAVEIYKKLTETYPMSVDVWLSYSNYYALTEDIQQACVILRDGLELLPENAQLVYRMANYYFLYEDYSAGVSYLRCAYKIDVIYLHQFLDYDEQTATLPIVVETINDLMSEDES